MIFNMLDKSWGRTSQKKESLKSFRMIPLSPNLKQLSVGKTQSLKEGSGGGTPGLPLEWSDALYPAGLSQRRVINVSSKCQETSASHFPFPLGDSEALISQGGRGRGLQKPVLVFSPLMKWGLHLPYYLVVAQERIWTWRNSKFTSIFFSKSWMEGGTKHCSPISRLVQGELCSSRDETGMDQLSGLGLCPWSQLTPLDAGGKTQGAPGFGAQILIWQSQDLSFLICNEDNFCSCTISPIRWE